MANEQLIAVLSADIRKLEKAMDRAANKANGTFTKIEKRGSQLEKRLSSINPNFGRFLGPAAVAGVARGFQVFADSAIRIENALKVAGLSGAELEKVYGRLEQSAKDNYAPFESLVTLYGRAALVQKELGITSEELFGFTNKIALALRVSGKSAAETSGALLQLSQALGSGVVRAEEFNSILEGALPIAQAAAAGLKEAGGSVSKLRQLVIDGKISSEAFFRAFEAGSVILEEKVAGAAVTTGQAYENLKTTLITTSRKVNEATGFTDALAGTLQQLVNILESADAQNLINALGAVIDKMSVGIAKAEEFKNSLRDALGLGALDDFLEGTSLVNGTFGRLSTQVRDRIDTALSTNIDYTGDLSEEQIQAFAKRRNLKRPASQPTSNVVAPVSLDDFAPVTAKKTSTKSGGSKASKSPTATFGEDVEQIKARTAAIIAETEALAGINPLINDNEFAVTKARAAQDLLNEAKKAGLEITPQLAATIDLLSTEFANATAEANQLAESQAKVVERAQEFNALGKDVMSGFISDLRAGKSASDALANSLNKIADKLLDMALNNLFAALPGGSSFGIGGPTKLPSFAGGGYTGGGARSGGMDGKGGYMAMLHPKETVVDHTKMGSRGGGGNNVQVLIENHTGAPVREEKGREGDVDFRRIIIGEVSKAIAGGDMDKSFGGRFGAKPAVRNMG